MHNYSLILTVLHHYPSWLNSIGQLHLDLNNISALPPSIVGWKDLVVLTLANNLLTGTYVCRIEW